MKTKEKNLKKNEPRNQSLPALVALLATLSTQPLATAAEPAHDEAHGSSQDSHATHLQDAVHDSGHHGLHFSPPLLGKNPTPVTK